MRKGAFLPLYAAYLVCVVGCTQVLGLGDYREAPETGVDDAAFGDEESGDGTTETYVSDLGSKPSFEDGTEGQSDATLESAGDAGDGSIDSAVDATDGAVGAVDDADAAQATDAAADADAQPLYDAPIDSLGEGNAQDAFSSDVSTEASGDAQSVDASNDVVGVCPVECNAGCGPSGTLCTIAISSVTSAPIVCPPGLACEIQCVGAQVCIGSIDCAAGQPCHVVCNGMDACNGGTINQGSATSLCVDCLHMPAMGSCNAVTCTGVCSIVCAGPGCSSSCGNCTSVSACP